MLNFHDRNSSNLLCLILSHPSDAELHLEMVQNDVPTNLSHFVKWTHPMGWAQRNHNISIFCGESQMRAGDASAGGVCEMHVIPPGKQTRHFTLKQGRGHPGGLGGGQEVWEGQSAWRLQAAAWQHCPLAENVSFGQKFYLRTKLSSAAEIINFSVK